MFACRPVSSDKRAFVLGSGGPGFNSRCLPVLGPSSTAGTEKVRHTKVLLVFQLGERRCSEEERESSVSKGPIKGAEAGKEVGRGGRDERGINTGIVKKVGVGREAGKKDKCGEISGVTT